MRISSALLLAIALGACGSAKTDQQALAKIEAEQDAKAEHVECAAKGQDFTRSCTVDRETTDQGLVLIVRHPDGAFHRLLVTKDGRGVIAADGAEKALVTVTGPGAIEVALAGDRYRLPATVKAPAGK